MKKTAFVLAAALMLGGCGGMGDLGGLGLGGGNTSNIGANLFSMYVQNQCKTELQSRSEWRLAALAMSQSQQEAWENKICGCVSEEAPNQLTAADLTQILTPEGRTRVVTEVGAKTVTACYKRLFTQR